MRFLKNFVKLMIFAVGLMIAAWIFMPWGRIGEYILVNSENAAAAKGFSMRHSAVSGSWHGPTVDIQDLMARMLLGGGGFKNISISPAIFASIINLSPVISVSFSGGEVSLPGGVVASLGSGSLELSFSSGIILMDKVKSAGEISLEGSVAIDPSKGRIERANLTVKSPEKLHNSISAMKGILPLTEGPNGTWLLKREAGNG